MAGTKRSTKRSFLRRHCHANCAKNCRFRRFFSKSSNLAPAKLGWLRTARRLTIDVLRTSKATAHANRTVSNTRARYPNLFGYQKNVGKLFYCYDLLCIVMLYLLRSELDCINPELGPLHVNEESPSLCLSLPRISP